MRQADALRAQLERDGLRLPVYVGMRNWHPYLRDTLADMQRDGVRRALGVILAAQQSDAGWERYQRDVAEARAALNGAAPAVGFADGWHAHPLFIEAVADQARGALASMPPEPTRRHAPDLHRAQHPDRDGGRLAVRSAVARRCGAGGRALSAMHRTRSPTRAAAATRPSRGSSLTSCRSVRQLAARGARDLLVVPLGFVCDHVEVLYDLDVEAKQVAEAAGIGFVRAPAVNDHPSFIRMLAELVGAHVRR